MTPEAPLWDTTRGFIADSVRATARTRETGNAYLREASAINDSRSREGSTRPTVAAVLPAEANGSGSTISSPSTLSTSSARSSTWPPSIPARHPTGSHINVRILSVRPDFRNSVSAPACDARRPATTAPATCVFIGLLDDRDLDVAAEGGRGENLDMDLDDPRRGSLSLYADTRLAIVVRHGIRRLDNAVERPVVRDGESHRDAGHEVPVLVDDRGAHARDRLAL